jgi:hypothetical protein
VILHTSTGYFKEFQKKKNDLMPKTHHAVINGTNIYFN